MISLTTPRYEIWSSFPGKNGSLWVLG